MKANFIIKLISSCIALNFSTMLCRAGSGPGENKAPNFIVIFADDMGYGDAGIYGHPTIRTPNLDEMASEGQKWTSFYVAASVCTPSRAGLITGRLPIRNGMCSSRRRVLFPDSNGGLPDGEHTIASLLKTAGYATACIGKWHLGHLPPYLPTEHGFDYYFGIPYSNDMDGHFDGVRYHDACRDPKPGYFNPPLMRNTEIIERPAEQATITKRYTEETIRFMEENQETPFFIYLAHSMPHVPLYRSAKFENRSLRGIYGDVIEELDWSVGEILAALTRLELDENTVVVFTSDNGPWLIFDDHGGSAGLLSGGKGGTYEGGMREPAIFWGPGIVKPQVVMEMGATLDLLPTFCSLANIKLPADRLYDGCDLTPVLTGIGAGNGNICPPEGCL
jgi:arylsulfatase A-like enzyme